MPNTKTRKAPAGKTKGSNGTATAQSNSQLEKYFIDALKDIYWAEKHLTKELPRMQKAATTQELKDAIEEHTAQTEEQVARLEQVFELLGRKPQAKKCEAMEGLIKEGEEQIEEYEEGHARDAALIGAAQKVEHYEISAYGTLRTMANVLGMTQCAEILEEIKDEEAETDVKLTELAEKINLLACEVDEEEA